MDLRILFSMLLVMYSGILHTVLSAPAGETPTASSSAVTPVHHARTKRCSCATFLDKECVYFCHLDIIWVNTPERIVSYGLGSAPRKRRAVSTAVTKKDPPRCKCASENDNTCANFCQMENRLRYDTSTDKVILSAEGDGCAEKQCKHTLAGKTSRIKRANSSDKRATSAVAVGAALKTRLLLEKWRVRQHHRARAWEGESTAS